MELKETQRNLFVTFIENLEIVEVGVEKISFNKQKNFSPPAKTNISHVSEFKMIDSENNLFVFLHTLNLKATMKGRKKSGLEIEVVYRILYKSKIPIEKEISDSFVSQSFVLHAWPYLREIIQDLTLRAALPPFTLPILNLGSGKFIKNTRNQ